METTEVGMFEFHDKIPLKHSYAEQEGRVVPHAIARNGAFIARGVVMMPWKLLSFYINWLVTYSGLLGPIMGVLVVDYVFVRKMAIDVDALYVEDSPYHYTGGFNLAAVGATILGIGVVALGFVVPSLGFLEKGAWFSGAISAGLVYYLFASRPKRATAKEV